MGNAIKGRASNADNVDIFGNVIDSAISPLNIGPKDIGRWPSKNPLSNRHFINAVNREGIGTAISNAAQNTLGSTHSSDSNGALQYAAGKFGIGNSLGQFRGTYNFGPGIGTLDFGAGKWSE